MSLYALPLCCPFDVFHKAMEEALGRPVWTHEFGLDWKGLKAELMGDRPTPSFENILNLIPKDKPIIGVVVPSEEKA